VLRLGTLPAVVSSGRDPSVADTRAAADAWEGSECVPGPTESPRPRTSVLNIPNLLSLSRLLLVPVFLWLLLGPEADGWAILVLAYSGASDYFDGKLARAWNQTSRVGELLDPIADRLYILATLLAFSIREIIPWWLGVVLVGRDIVLGIVQLVLQRRGSGPLPVHFLGKAATFNLLYAFPLLLIGDGTGSLATVANVFGWAFVWWGTALYLYSGVLYVIQAFQVARRPPAVATTS
jgi:cardiolipin synthase